MGAFVCDCMDPKIEANPPPATAGCGFFVGDAGAALASVTADPPAPSLGALLAAAQFAGVRGCRRRKDRRRILSLDSFFRLPREESEAVKMDI